MSAPSGKPIDPSDPSTYAPKRAPMHSALDQPAVEDDNKVAVLLPTRALRGELQTDTSVDLAGGNRSKSPPPPNPVEGKTAESPSAYETEVDAELQRLASSSKRLQREDAVVRLPRAAPLRPVSGLRPVAVEAPRSRRDQFINGIRVPPSLAADRLNPPAEMWEWHDHLRWPLLILLVTAIAGAIAYSVGGLGPTSKPKTELPKLAPRLVTSTEFPIRKEGLRPSEAEDHNTVAPSLNKSLDQQSDSSQGVTSPSPARDDLAATVVPELDPQAIELFMQQGEQFVASGDLVMPGFCSGGRRKPATRPPPWHWAQLSIRSGWQSSVYGALAATSRRRETGIKKPRNPALPTLHAGSKCWHPARVIRNNREGHTQ
jgi:hypothetical protein